MPRLPLPDLPLSASLPAAGALLAYLDAKYHFVGDIWGVWNAIAFQRHIKKLESSDRINSFYRFEELAKNPKTASRAFLVIPQDPEQPAAKTEWTWAEAYEIVLKYARWLKDTHSVKRHEIIAIDFRNSPHFIWLWFALWSLGAKPAFINSNLQDNAFIHCVTISNTRLLILDPGLVDILTDEAKSKFSPDDKGRAIETVVLDASAEAQIHALDGYRAPDDQRGETLATDAAILIYTSGTTGLPKAANVAWTKPMSGEYFFPKLLSLTPEDRFFTSMPLYHTSASVLGVCQSLGSGCTLIVGRKFSPRTQLRDISETRATVMQYIGEMCRYLVSSPPSPYDKAHNLRLAFGNGLRPDVWQVFKDRFNVGTICEFYGATESPGASMVLSRNSFLRGAIGKQGLILRVLFGGNTALLKHDHDTDLPRRDAKSGFCIRADANEPGELVYWLDPANVKDKYQGYYGNDKASESKILRDVFKKGDIYYRSGDLQRRDADGRSWFVDRIGDTFRWKGENVSTNEVSEALGTHGALEEANVYGIQLPNHDGRAGCAAIGLKDGQSLDGSLGFELAEHARKRLPKYAVPLFLRSLKQFEVTGTMKHQKVSLRNQGVDPSKTGDDELFWLPPSSNRYVRFTKNDWESISNGGAKL